MLFFGRRAPLFFLGILLLVAAACNASPQPQPPFGQNDAGTQQDAGSTGDAGQQVDGSTDGGGDADVSDGGTDGGDSDGGVSP